jgi:hypothetical protein
MMDDLIVWLWCMVWVIAMFAVYVVLAYGY